MMHVVLTHSDFRHPGNSDPSQMLSAQPEWRFWLHLDVDVLDQTMMPAVDSPGSPGIDRLWLENIVAQLLQNPLCCGITVSVFDPDLDPDGWYAVLIVEMLEAMFRRRQQ